MNLKSLRLKRQKYSFNKVSVINDNDFKKYKSIVEKSGMMIYNSGLINSLAFIKNDNSALYNHIEEWLKPKLNNYRLGNANDSTIKRLILIDDSRILMDLTNEALLLCDSLKEMIKSI